MRISLRESTGVYLPFLFIRNTVFGFNLDDAPRFCAKIYGVCLCFIFLNAFQQESCQFINLLFIFLNNSRISRQGISIITVSVSQGRGDKCKKKSKQFFSRKYLYLKLYINQSKSDTSCDNNLRIQSIEQFSFIDPTYTMT